MDYSTLADDITFVVGAERSGSTLLRLMLDHHPQIAWCSEFEYAVELLEDTEGWPNLQAFYDKIETDRIFLAHGFSINKKLSYEDLVKSFLVQRKQQTSKPIVGATCHKKFDKLLKIWKNAKFIHILRDPRDVARSSQGMGWAGNVWVGLDRWIHAEETWERLSKILSNDRKLEIRYEDLVTNTEATLQKICSFIGTPYDSSMFDYVKSTEYTLPDPKLITQWRHKLSEVEIQLIEARVSELIKARGFELSGLPELEVTPNMIRKLKVQNWWYCLQFRIQRYGLRLTFLEFLARKLRLDGFQKKLTYEMNDIVNAYCKFDGNPQILEARKEILTNSQS